MVVESLIYFDEIFTDLEDKNPHSFWIFFGIQAIVKKLGENHNRHIMSTGYP